MIFFQCSPLLLESQGPVRCWKRYDQASRYETVLVQLNLSQSNSDEIKKLLFANTTEALAEGCFGVPWYVGKIMDFSLSTKAKYLLNQSLAINGEGQKEGFWGFDHLALVADHLGLQRPTPGTVKEGGWRALL